MESRRSFVRALLLVGGILTLFFVGEFVFEWLRLGRPGLGDLSWADKNNAKLVDVLSPMARAYNNILAMLLATVGLAIPLTASMHTPKLIDMFLRDRMNQIMLGLIACGAANVIFVAYLVGPGFAPVWAYRVAVFGAMLGWAALVPYFFYVMRFLDPSEIISRLKGEVCRVVEQARAGRIAPEAAQDVVHERLHQIGTIVLKAIDRFDRGVVLEGIWSLKNVLDHYGQHKAAMPEAWFKVGREDFVGASVEALEVLNEERSWFEHRALGQMLRAYQSALSKGADAISALSDATRVIAMRCAGRGDQAALGLAIRHFNNYLREAVKRRDTHAIYDIFYQYRLLARDLQDPSVVRQIGKYFRYYAEIAAGAGLQFVCELAAFDLGWMVRRAYESASPAAADLLGELLGLSQGKGSPMLVASRLVLGGYFLEKGMAGEAARVREALAGIGAAEIAAGEKLLAEAVERVYWEVTDRQVNIAWVQPERREHLRAFVASLAAA